MSIVNVDIECRDVLQLINHELDVLLKLTPFMPQNLEYRIKFLSEKIDMMQKIKDVFIEESLVYEKKFMVEIKDSQNFKENQDG